MPGGDHLFLLEPQLIGEIGSELEGVFRFPGRSQVEDVFGTGRNCMKTDAASIWRGQVAAEKGCVGIPPRCLSQGYE